MSELTGTWVHEDDRTQVLKINSVGQFEVEGIDDEEFIRALSTDRVRVEGETVEGAGTVWIPDPDETTQTYRDVRFDFDPETGDLSGVGSIPVFVDGPRGSRVIIFTNPDLSPRYNFEKIPVDSNESGGDLS